MIVLSNKIFSVALLIVLLQTTSFAQVSFTASVSPRVIGKDETTELKLMVENATQVDQITPPSLKNFIVISGPNQESRMESINGVTRQYIGITYILRPRAKGKFTIGAAIAKADGKRLRSNTVRLEVTNTSTGNSSANSLTPLVVFHPIRIRMFNLHTRIIY
jgi:hypothetical protein